MKRWVRTTKAVLFRDMRQENQVPGVDFTGVSLGAGQVCFSLVLRGGRMLIMPAVPHENCVLMAEVNEDDYEEIPAMEFLAEVHAGNVPEEALKGE